MIQELIAFSKASQGNNICC